MKKSLFFGLISLVILASAVSAQLTTDWQVFANGVNVKDSPAPVFLLGQENTIRLDFTAVNSSSNVQIIVEWSNSQNQTGFGLETSPFNIVRGMNYSRLMPFETFSSLVPEGKYLMRISIRNLQGTSDNKEIVTFFQSPRIPIYGCGDLNITDAYYVLKKDIKAEDRCFTINAQLVKLDLNLHKVIGAQRGDGVLSNNLYYIAVKNGEISNFSHGISIWNGQYHEISNMLMNHNQGSGISISGGGSHIIKNSAIKNVGYSHDGVTMYGSSNNLIINDTFYHNGEGIYIEEGENNTIQGSRIVNGDIGVSFFSSANNNIINTILDNGLNLKLSGLSEDNRCNHVLTNVSDLNGRPILLYNSRVNLTNEEVNELVLCNADESSFDNIRILNTGNYNNGLHVFRTENTLLSNIFINNTFGLYIDKSSNITITNLRSNNNHYGLKIGRSFNISLLNSVISNNRRGGVVLENVYGFIFTGNYIGFNSQFGILMDDDITQGLIYNNIFHNIRNLAEYNSETYQNSWNVTLRPGYNILKGPYLGGNFWADMNGTGFSETCADTNYDGICDQPYLIDANNTDYLPLTNPLI